MQITPSAILTPANSTRLQTLYVIFLFDVMGRALEAATQLDPIIRREIERLPAGFIFEMSVMPNGPGIVLIKQYDGSFKYLGSKSPLQPHLRILIKHIAHAFLLFTFQESTAAAFANDRMVVDGDISLAMRILRSLNRLEAFILPKLIAQRAIKRYPNITLREKTYNGARIYARVASNLAKRMING